jgi:hypothetical protein
MGNSSAEMKQNGGTISPLPKGESLPISKQLPSIQGQQKTNLAPKTASIAPLAEQIRPEHLSPCKAKHDLAGEDKTILPIIRNGGRRTHALNSWFAIFHFSDLVH